jgi:hypothetical protein
MVAGRQQRVQGRSASMMDATEVWSAKLIASINYSLVSGSQTAKFIFDMVKVDNS